jgi:riboflavin synthase
MFTGIIEAIGIIKSISTVDTNKVLCIEVPFASELRIDQSVAHNGVCLTVTRTEGNTYFVTCIDETLSRSNLGTLREGDVVNLERSIAAGARMDGHFVLGHVDQTATVLSVIDAGGSWLFGFQYDPEVGNITVEKGSVCVNGVSLTVIDSRRGYFSVAIIPYTFEHTNLKNLNPGSVVNVEFDILGKYVTEVLKKTAQ